MAAQGAGLGRPSQSAADSAQFPDAPAPASSFHKPLGRTEPSANSPPLKPTPVRPPEPANLAIPVCRDNPLDSIAWHVPQSSANLDPAVVASPAQVSALLDTVARTRPELTAFFGCLYYAALRPEEAVALRLADCDLPSAGWGVLRLVPAPPMLAAMLRAHVTAYGTASDGRLFRGTRSGPLSESVYDRAWHSARTLALGPDLAASGLARRPYDLRHAALSLWLNAGGDPAQIAARAGHSVAVLAHRVQPLHPRPRRPPQPADRPRPRAALEVWSVPVRGKPAVTPTARRARTPSAIRPWLPRPARRLPAEHADTNRAQQPGRQSSSLLKSNIRTICEQQRAARSGPRLAQRRSPTVREPLAPTHKSRCHHQVTPALNC